MRLADRARAQRLSAAVRKAEESRNVKRPVWASAAGPPGMDCGNGGSGSFPAGGVEVPDCGV